MLEFERKYGDEFSCICGIDEAGRGPFAGPVVAGAVILPKGLTIEGLNDSKQVSAKKREELYDEIKEKVQGLTDAAEACVAEEMDPEDTKTTIKANSACRISS